MWLNAKRKAKIPAAMVKKNPFRTMKHMYEKGEIFVKKLDFMV